MQRPHQWTPGDGRNAKTDSNRDCDDGRRKFNKNAVYTNRFICINSLPSCGNRPDRVTRRMSQIVANAYIFLTTQVSKPDLDRIMRTLVVSV
ncbi:MAG: hypothetical protein MI923_18920 [Phycisphaerales bacterium]|nr:hypothetical protein [Phycisphaerales bacterium]